MSSPNGSLAAPNPAFSELLTPSPSNILKSRSKSHVLPIIGGVLGGVFLVSLSIIVCFIIVYRRKKAKQKFIQTMMSKEDNSKIKWVSTLDDSTSNGTLTSVGSSLPSDLCRRFSLAQIKVATCDFDEGAVIGTGGFGKVYKGCIDDGATIVAVKRLNTTSKQGAREFQTEIEMLSKLRHIHLVSLIGYCEEQGEMIIVYEYMARGTLQDHLLYKNKDKNKNIQPLSWKQRLRICVGSARGLHYLHAGANQLIIHRDVKSTNILLDDKWTAKVSDFGLSKEGPVPGEAGATHVSTAVKGSIGYLDPEYYRRQQLTDKSDVYSFGVLLFEVLCARPAMNPHLPKEQVNLAFWARDHYKRKILHTIVDATIRHEIAPECLRKFGDIAETCVRDRGSERPSMGDVVWGLEFALQLQETAEQNNVSVDHTKGNFSFNYDGENGKSAYNDVSTSGDNFSETSVVDSSEVNKLLGSTSKTTSNSTDYLLEMKSGSVFSEIIDPNAR